jgi:hypothetical protein
LTSRILACTRFFVPLRFADGLIEHRSRPVVARAFET